ncbi:MAG: hypothetical protein WA709_08105 [Stellaceae bacterium]
MCGGPHPPQHLYRYAAADPKIKERHGRIVKTTGDGMPVEFSSVIDAVRCAVNPVARPGDIWRWETIGSAAATAPARPMSSGCWRFSLI